MKTDRCRRCGWRFNHEICVHCGEPYWPDRVVLTCPRTETTTTAKTLTPYHRWLITQRQWCERCSDLTKATVVRNYNGKDLVLCASHADRLDAARILEEKQEKDCHIEAIEALDQLEAAQDNQ